MFFIVTKRVVKLNTGRTEQFAPRTANHEEWTISGPLSKRSLAERAAVSALGTHTCLSAQVHDVASLQALRPDAPYQLGQAITTILRAVTVPTA